MQVRSSGNIELHSGDDTTEFESIDEVQSDAAKSETQNYAIKDIKDNEQENIIKKDEKEEEEPAEENENEEALIKKNTGNKKNVKKVDEINHNSSNISDNKRHDQKKSPIFLKNIVVRVPRMVLKEAKSRMHKKKRRHDGSSSECGDESTWSTLSTESYVDYIGDPINLHCAMITTDEQSQRSEKELLDVSGNESKVIMYGNDVEIKKVINDISNDSSEPVNNKDLQEQVPEDKTEISEIVSEIVSDSENETDIVEHENDNTVVLITQDTSEVKSDSDSKDAQTENGIILDRESSSTFVFERDLSGKLETIQEERASTNEIQVSDKCLLSFEKIFIGRLSEPLGTQDTQQIVNENEPTDKVHEVEQPGADLVSKASFREVKKLEDKEESRPISLSNNKITVGALVNEEGSNDPNSVTFTETSSSGEYESQRFYKVQNGESRKAMFSQDPPSKMVVNKAVKASPTILRLPPLFKNAEGRGNSISLFMKISQY
ncbi:unnamed protein product [Hymenolepis diminuta]|uniref:Uncharacterized protein n=1 Tax=Hymenolepis diminuta TaxID=6216 RepID=A0A564Y932_HYMDI|nr:unnamed protein product [Hymenolepis diminuta]